VEAVIAPGSESASSPSPRSLTTWIEGWQPEEAPLLNARQRAAEVGVAAVDPATGAVLRLLAAAADAKAVVELGTGAGVSALWLLSGMREDGVLTSVDSEGEHQRLAKQSLTEAGVPSGRARLIPGRALDVLPRLSDGAYDLVFCDAGEVREPRLPGLRRPAAAPRRLHRVRGRPRRREGGRPGSPRRRDGRPARPRPAPVREDTRLVPAMLPVGQGLLVAALAG
jgi:hypothetical protein